jgi:zinc transport system permease protein
MIFAVIASISLPVIKRKTSTASDTLIGIFWASGMALGILFIGLTPGYPPDMTSYLFGDILTVSTLYLVLLSVLSVIVLIVFISMIKVVGIILAIALLTIPSAIAKLYTKSLKVQMIFATFISMVTSIGGLILSYYFNIPSGATIILLAVLVYMLAYVIKKRS